MHVQVGVWGLWVTAAGELDDGAQQAPFLERVPVDARGVGYVGCLPLRPARSAAEAPSLSVWGWATSQLGR